MAPMPTATQKRKAFDSSRLPYSLATSSRGLPSSSGELASPVSTTTGAATIATREWRFSASGTAGPCAPDQQEEPDQRPDPGRHAQQVHQVDGAHQRSALGRRVPGEAHPAQRNHRRAEHHAQPAAIRTERRVALPAPRLVVRDPVADGQRE